MSNLELAATDSEQALIEAITAGDVGAVSDILPTVDLSEDTQVLEQAIRRNDGPGDAIVEILLTDSGFHGLCTEGLKVAAAVGNGPIIERLAKYGDATDNNCEALQIALFYSQDANTVGQLLRFCDPNTIRDNETSAFNRLLVGNFNKESVKVLKNDPRLPHRLLKSMREDCKPPYGYVIWFSDYNASLKLHA